MIVVSGEVLVDNKMLKPGQLAYLVVGHDECDFTTTASSKAILVDGVPFAEKILMWWNFVACTQHEIAEAWLHWADGDERFGIGASPFQRIEVGPSPWVLHHR